MKKVISTLSIAIFILAFTSCKEEKGSSAQDLNEENSVEITDLTGKVRIPKSPKRVVAYSYPMVDILDDLGLGDRIIGFSKQNTPDYLKKYKDNDDLEHFGGTKDPNFEKINAAEPDLIIMERRIEKDHEELAKIAPVLFLDTDFGDYVNSIKNNVSVLGEIFEKEDKAKEIIAQIEESIEDYKAPEDVDENALVVMFNNGKFSAFGPNSRYGFIHDDFNVIPVEKEIDASVHGYNISSEYIQEKDPDILFVEDKNAGHQEGEIDTSGVENKLVRQTNAYKNDKIIYLTPDLWYYGGGGSQGIRLMAKDIGKAFK